MILIVEKMDYPSGGLAIDAMSFALLLYTSDVKGKYMAMGI